MDEDDDDKEPTQTPVYFSDVTNILETIRCFAMRRNYIGKNYDTVVNILRCSLFCSCRKVKSGKIMDLGVND